MRTIQLYKYGLGRRKCRHGCGITYLYDVEVSCAIADMIRYGDAMVVVYAGSYDKYAKIRINYELAKKYMAEDTDICASCTYNYGVCPLRVFKGLL